MSIFLPIPCTDFDVSVIAEDGSAMANIPTKNVVMRLWKSTAESAEVPRNALSCCVDKPTSNDKEGHFYFRFVYAPEKNCAFWALLHKKLRSNKSQNLESQNAGL